MMVLPPFRKQRLSVKSRDLDDLFESHAVAAEALEKWNRGVPQQAELHTGASARDFKRRSSD
ncbi:hypothetical protein [Ensifer sp. LCM 4579]|uniref:hypothetical protein n=1 Tax=Ensifer sp. LCM 4579 TaxID=1848292 RepID=UPI0008DA6FA5|nr:hypothetical protein [Ensifer sp. LCM 4579]OHV75358.1 hypothetical protein LCM4579_07460 [Ensifer sp. LCM 4579]